VTGFFSATYRARGSGSYRSLAGLFIPGDAHGIYVPFAALLSLAGDDAFERLAPTCRLALRIAASFIVAGSIQAGRTMIRLAAASGFWPREAAVPCDLSAPL
jgi:hypothetical protein